MHDTAEATCRLRLGCGPEILQTAALPLAYSTAIYCTPVWFSSALTCLIDSVFNNALLIATCMLVPHSKKPSTHTFKHPTS